MTDDKPKSRGDIYMEQAMATDVNDIDPAFVAEFNRIQKEHKRKSAERRADLKSTEMRFGLSPTQPHDRFARDYSDGLRLRAGLIPKSAASTSALALRDMRLLEAFKQCTRAHGGDVSRLNETDVLNAAMAELDAYSLGKSRYSVRLIGARDITETQFSQTVSDFPVILGDTLHKSGLQGYDEAPETWNLIVRQSGNSDFKPFKRITRPEFPTPDPVAENAEKVVQSLGDGMAETGQLVTRATKLSISRQVLINDDADMITVNAEAAGRAASRAIGDAVYDILKANPDMSDGAPLFNSTDLNGDHLNLGTGTTLDLSAVDEARALMGAQVGPSGETLNLQAFYVVCARGLEGSASTLRNAQYDPDQRSEGYDFGKFNVVTDTRLDGGTVWFVIANPMKHPLIDVVGLDGPPRPRYEVRPGFTRDGIEVALAIDFDALAVDYRPGVMHPGV